MNKNFLLSSIVYAVVCLFGSPAAAITESGTCGTNCVWIFEDGTLTMRSADGTPARTDDYYNLHPWQKYRESATAIVVEDSITYIGTWVFSGFLTENVRVPEGVTFGASTTFYATPYVIVNGKLEKCSEHIVGCNKCAQNGQCHTCDDGYYYKEWGSRHWCVDKEEGCGEGYIHTSKKCISAASGCPAGYLVQGDACWTTEEGCPDGYYEDDDGRTCAPIKTSYTMQEAESRTTNDNNNYVEWIFE